MSEGFIPGLRYQSPAQELWALVVESLGGWEERLNQSAAAAALSPVSAWALVQLDPESPISQKELAARLRCNPSTVVDPTDRLEEATSHRDGGPAGNIHVRSGGPCAASFNSKEVVPALAACSAIPSSSNVGITVSSGSRQNSEYSL